MPELVYHVKAKLVAEIANSRFSQKGSIALTFYLFLMELIQAWKLQTKDPENQE
jgi:hypothetical protein